MELLQVKSLPEPEMLYWKTWLFEFTNIVHKHAQANIYKAFILDSCTHTQHAHARTRTPYPQTLSNLMMSLPHVIASQPQAEPVLTPLLHFITATT